MQASLPKLHHLVLVSSLLCLMSAASRAAAGDDGIADECRLTLFPSYKITEEVTGFGYLGYASNPDEDYWTGYLGTGATYAPSRWLQLWGGMFGLFTDDETSADKLELRPFAGFKVFLPNRMRWHIYNFTRYECRLIDDLETHDWSDIHRVRSRFGMELPLTARDRAWQPQTWYVLADVEPVWRFDRGTVDPLRFRTGLGYIASDRVRVEFQYYAQLTRPGGGSLEHTDNVFRLNFKLSLEQGLLQKLFDTGFDD